MNEEYWVFGELEKSVGKNFFNKDPDTVCEILPMLSIKKKDRVLLTPKVIQNQNLFEFYTLYENNDKKIAERYMSLVVCERPVDDILPVINLSKSLEDCANEEEKKLWLRIASPVADSAAVLREFGVKTRINHKYLQKHRVTIVTEAHKKKVLYHVHSRYCDGEQVLTDLALQHAF